MRGVLALSLLLVVPGCVAITDFGGLHGRDGAVELDGGPSDGGGLDASMLDAPRLDGGGADARVDAPSVDAPSVDARADVAAPPTDACTVDVARACSGRCGSVEDTVCGVSVDCGDPCRSPQTCGGGGMATFCGCTAEPMATTCAGHCGPVTNNCGTSIDCGNPCTGFQTCGGGGTPSVCGCTPDADPCGDARQICGTISNGCGGTLSCGGCPSGRMCCRDSCAPTGGECP